MTQEEADKIYLSKYPLINECYYDVKTKNKNGYNYKRMCYGGSFSKQDDLIHYAQVRENGDLYFNGIKVNKL